MTLTFLCVFAFALMGMIEALPLNLLEKLTLDGVLLVIIWYLLTQGRTILDRFAGSLDENTKAIRRLVKRIERVEKIVKPEPWSEESEETGSNP